MFLTRAATASDKLSGTYRTISGGGNTALGGDVMIAAGTNITFYPDGKFESKSGKRGSSSRVTTSSSSTANGTYSLEGHSITMRYADGRTMKTAFAYMDPKGDKGICIGKATYTKRS